MKLKKNRNTENKDLLETFCEVKFFEKYVKNKNNTQFPRKNEKKLLMNHISILKSKTLITSIF